MTLVKLDSFRIQNFRSIVDSGWKNLAADDITILIGQNESGKTTVLEALHSFYTGLIIEDIFRSDQSLPIVSCKFSIHGKETLVDFLDSKKLPQDLLDKIINEREFSLTRKWGEDKSNTISLLPESIFSFYEKLELKEKESETKTLEEINSIISDGIKITSEFENIESEKKRIQSVLTEKRKILEDNQKIYRKAKKSDQKLIAENALKHSKKEYEAQENLYIAIAEKYEEVKSKTNSLSEHIIISHDYKELLNTLDQNTKVLEDKKKQVLDFRHLCELSTSRKDRKRNQKNLEKSLLDVQSLSIVYNNLLNDKQLSINIAKKVLKENLSIQTAEQTARKEIEKQNTFYNLFSLGEVLEKRIPKFEFFEDFSGLLPNKIDLEDILNEHEYVEGYKAAKNFLHLTGLDVSFFREKNQRILKQGIEALNSDLTINFQDYWSQFVGKNNKIKLHLELEHYDYNVSDKSGKPYLEFWIKDNRERLYPKQRSRGVRWFLSFYLELKATEAKKSGNRILLIDEPGLSLHARAQEDVLKVFEDLKNTMQIIYCTHSPHLVQSDKLYRVLAVQRKDENDDSSESLIFEPSKLNKVSADTLTPIYSLMGIRLSDQQFVNKSGNIILPDATTYYYLHFLSKLFPKTSNLNFIPATDEKTLPLLINILASWQVGFGVLVFNRQKNSIVDLSESTLLGDIEEHNGRSIILEDLDMIEDVFSTLDFKKYIIQKREGITDKNSEYIIENGLSRKILATNFVNSFKDSTLRLDNFDETTNKNLETLFIKLNKLLKP